MLKNSAMRAGVLGSFVLHLTALATLGAIGGFAVQKFQAPAPPQATAETPATREGHTERTEQVKASLEKMVANLNRLEKIDGRTKSVDEKVIAEATRRAPAEAMQRLSEAAKAQRQASEALKRATDPKNAQVAAAKAQERARRAVSLLPPSARNEVTPQLSKAEVKQFLAQEKAQTFARQKSSLSRQQIAAQRQALLAAQRDAEAALQKALADAQKAMDAAAKSGDKTAMKLAKVAAEPHAPGEHTLKCFAPGGT